VVKIVNEELISTLGEPEPLNLSGPRPRTIMLVGLQGSGKTTASGKLARTLRSQGERVLLVAGDPYRPAAARQLETLGNQMDIPVFVQENVPPPKLGRQALDFAGKGGHSVVIFDTAGRSQLDDEMMDELHGIEQQVKPVEILLVADAMMGQEAVNIAQGFSEVIPLSGLILTKMDGDARGGAAISIRSVTGVPIKYLGVGEGLEALEVFEPSRLASRILGMGDVIGLIEKAEEAYDEEVALEQAEKMISGQFTLEDFADQLGKIRKMGPIGQLMDMMPGGMGQISKQISPQDAEDQLKRTEAIINSMTRQEKRKPELLNASRRRRIASGSGTQVRDVNQLIKQFRQTQKMFKMLKKSGGRGIPGLFG
jgi:signal recognition particle subunit SRP54